MNWLALLKYGLPMALVAFVLVETNNVAYDHGETAADTKCAEKTVPAARAEEIQICAAKAKITEDSNAQNLTNKDAARARAERQLDSLRRKGTGSCIPITNNPRMDGSGAQTVRPTGARGLDAGYLVDLGNDCRERSDEYLQCRAFVLSTWKLNDSLSHTE